MPHQLVAAARDLADEILFPQAGEIDAAEVVPGELFDRLAGAGLYGLEASELPETGRRLVAEILASGSMSVAFVWIQHHTALRDLLSSTNTGMAAEWVPDMVSGVRRCGIAIGGAVGPRPTLRAEQHGGDWVLDGVVPWVTGWGMVDAFDTVAVTGSGDEVRLLVEPSAVVGLRPQRHRLVAANASSTVRLGFDGVRLTGDRVIVVQPRPEPDPNDGGGRGNGSLALGVIRRIVALIGPSVLDAELDRARDRLDSADDSEMAEARARASELAVRAAARLVVHTGSAAVEAGSHAERLTREALFTTVFGSRPAIKRALESLLGQR